MIGLARNTRLHALVAEAEMKIAFGQTEAKQRRFQELARTWQDVRRCVARLEYGAQGTNPRVVVTNIPPGERDAAQLCDQLYCPRGEAENRIKEAQLGLFATRTSCHQFNANQFRVLLSALAYTLVERLRALALKGTAGECTDRHFA